MTAWVLVYHERDDHDQLLCWFPTEAEADAEVERIEAVIARGCELAGAGPYSLDLGPGVVEVPAGPAKLGDYWGGHYYWVKALVEAGEWPG